MNLKYRAEIDGLRAIAVLPVILFHAGFEAFSGGFVGVDVFFVISGYLITTILIDDIEQGRFSIVSFYERRARRILPALFFVMLACLPFAWAWMVPSQLKDFSESLLAVSFFVSNFLFWQESGYFDASVEEKPLLHTWSLSVEEQYYVLFPLFLIFAWRFGKRNVFWLIVGLAIFSLALSEWSWRNSPTANFYLAPTRAWELFAGSISAFIVQKRGVIANNGFAWVGFISIVVAIFLYNENTPFPSVYTVLPVLGVVFIILFAGKTTVVANLLSTKVLVGVGLISYSAYLWHQPLFAFARIKLYEAPSVWLMGGLSLFSLGLAMVSWRFVEQPFRKASGGACLSRKGVFLSAVIMMCLFSSIGIVGHKLNGFEAYIPSENQRAFLRTAVKSPKRSDCHTSGSEPLVYANSCEYYGKNIEVAVFGDSHAVELAYALSKKLEKNDVGIKHLSFSACIPSFNTRFEGFEDCASWTSEIIDKLVEDDNIKTVVISYRLAFYLYGEHLDTYPELNNQNDDEHREAIWRALVELIEHLKNAGKNVVYVMQAPELQKSVEFLAPERHQIPFGVEKEWWLKRNKYVYDRLEDLTSMAKIVDPAKYLCRDQYCVAGESNKAYYYDANHVSGYGAGLVAEEVVRQIGSFK